MAFLACVTIATSLVADWQATNRLFSHYGPQYEANPIIRTIGPSPYFGVLTVATALTCRENDPGWAVAAVVLWAVQTWAVSTHEPYRTVVSYPVLVFHGRWR